LGTAFEAYRRLGELQTIRAGIIAGLTEWKNRKNSGMVGGASSSRCWAVRRPVDRQKLSHAGSIS